MSLNWPSDCEENVFNNGYVNSCGNTNLGGCTSPLVELYNDLPTKIKVFIIPKTDYLNEVGNFYNYKETFHLDPKGSAIFSLDKPVVDFDTAQLSSSESGYIKIIDPTFDIDEYRRQNPNDNLEDISILDSYTPKFEVCWSCRGGYCAREIKPANHDISIYKQSFNLMSDNIPYIMPKSSRMFHQKVILPLKIVSQK